MQLVNTRTRNHIWAERYDTPLNKLFETQDDIIRKIVGSLVPRIEVESLALARAQADRDAGGV